MKITNRLARATSRRVCIVVLSAVTFALAATAARDGRTADGEGYRVYSDGRMPMFYEAQTLAKDFAAVEARYAPEIVVVDWQVPSPILIQSCERAAGFPARYALVPVSSGAKVTLRRGGPHEALTAGLEAR